MLQKVTNGIQVNVQVQLETNHTQVERNYYLFSYRITIQNLSNKRVQLLRRNWYVTDFVAYEKMIEGDGVIGQQPIIEPTNSYTYTSYCELNSGVGSMEGYYTFLDFTDLTTFKVDIPKFELVAPWVLN